MVTNNNSNLTQEIRDVGKIQVGKEDIPNLIRNEIIPVIDVNPKHARVINIVKQKNATGTDTVYTTPADKDFYLVFACLSSVQDAASTNTQTLLRVSLNGALSDILVHAKFPSVTDYGSNNTFSPAIPLKVDRNTAITVGTAGAGTIRISASIAGYIVDNSNA